MPTPISPAQGQAIVRWLERRVGRRIGRGECWDAADQAIHEVGAERLSGFTYRWGNQIYDVRQLRPGDVLQFTRFEIDVSRQDGSGEVTILGAPDHTAVVRSVNADGSVNVLHQNAGVRVVTVGNNLFLESGIYGTARVVVRGSVGMYRPMIPG